MKMRSKGSKGRCELTLHDQEVWVIGVELDTLEDSLDDNLLSLVTI